MAEVFVTDELIVIVTVESLLLAVNVACSKSVKPRVKQVEPLGQLDGGAIGAYFMVILLPAP
jgi:hypothetical protein